MENNTIKNQVFWDKCNVIVFSAFLILTGFFFLILPKNEISEGEKRKLADFPSFSWQKFMEGKFTDSIDLYFSDNFVLRDELIALANNLRDMRGIKNDEIRLYTRGANSEKQILSKEHLSESENFPLVISDTMTFPEKSAKEEAKKSKTAEDYVPDKIENHGDYENIKSVIVYNKKAVQVFSGSKKSATYFAKMLKKYKEMLGNDINLYCMAMPVGSDFYLPSKVSKNNRREKHFIDMLYEEITPYATPVYAYEVLDKHREEYLHFNTDHHWTGRAAMYAYHAFGEAAGFEPMPEEEMKRKVIKGFLGTMYYYTLSPELKANKDSVEYFKIPYKTDAFYFSEGIEKGKPTKMLAEYAKGGGAYGVFLGADFPLMRIISENKTGRRILQIKDSYGNAFTPFLPANFEEVFVIDYRYFKGSVRELVEKYEITDVIFTHNVFMINATFTAQRAIAFM